MNKVALITGGQRGIGFGIARVLVDNGWKVALVSLPPIDDADVQTALVELGDAARYYCHDMRDLEAINNMVSKVEAELGPVISLISNAGVGAPKRGDLLDLETENFEFVHDINLKGTFFLAQALAKKMVGRPETVFRSLVFVTSVSAEMVSIERAEYCLSKAGASMMVKLFAARLASEGIGVYELQPGIIETGMTAGVKSKYDDRIKDGLVPALRWGQSADIADAVLPLVEGQMAFCSGASIPVDGGLSIPRL